MNREQALELMADALDIAARGQGTTRPNPMVGAIVVRHGARVGEGYHIRAGGAHAEVHALQMAGEEARDAELIVTLEPCCHVGRTPACTDSIMAAGISVVWVGCLDPNPKVAGKGVQALRDAGIQVYTGLLEKECSALNAGYNHWMIHGLPHVTLKLATSLDGKIATASGASRWITGPDSRRSVHLLRAQSDAIMVGRGTVLADDPALSVRDVPYEGAPPTRLVVDSLMQVNPRARIFSDDGAEVIIATTESAPQKRRDVLESAGATVVALSATDGRVDLEALFRHLAQRETAPIRSILVEGGSGLAATLIQADLVDVLRVFIAPLCIGGDGLSALASLGLDALDGAPRFKLADTRRHGDDIELIFHRQTEKICSQD